MKIVIGVDFSRDSMSAVRLLTRLRFPKGSELYLVHVIKGTQEIRSLGSSADLEQGLREIHRRSIVRAKGHLSRLKEQFLDPSLMVHMVIKEGNPGEELLSVVEKQGVDLAVLGTRGLSGIKRFLLGSVSEWILHEAPCSVLICRDRSRISKRPMRVLAAIDGSREALHALNALTRLTFPENSEIVLFHVVEPTDYRVVQDDFTIVGLPRTPRPILQQTAQDIRNRIEHAKQSVMADAKTRLQDHSVKMEKISTGYAAEEIIKAATRFRVDLIVMGSRGLTRTRRMFLGSVSNKVARHAPCSVFVVRKPQKPERVRL